MMQKPWSSHTDSEFITFLQSTVQRLVIRITDSVQQTSMIQGLWFLTPTKLGQYASLLATLPTPGHWVNAAVNGYVVI